LRIKRNIFLAGFMGTGKSTIGRELARFMGRKFVDMDQLLEARLGKTINEIFDDHGEDFFREKELELAKELVQQQNRVVATGGGTILNDEIRNLFADNGLIICLVADKDQLIQRLKRTDKRPLLRGDREEIAEKVERLLEDRQNVYFRIPIRVDTTNLTPQEAARKIIDTLNMKIRILDQLHDQYIFIS
jgi:shikimate kinase